ncbi:purple acid phosphatase 18 [Striga asiatica]|uniref:Purple acid phosphatase 18 n=1 Tax=Striga asiatica TaxID=4170 RepID=A0A5A7R917_STRAF|nr:purple acid phosphatase 18 [Striga asiatica]
MQVRSPSAIDRVPRLFLLSAHVLLPSVCGGSKACVHISLSGPNHMGISWITSYPTPPVVYFGSSPGPGSKRFSANGSTNQYGYLTYQSGQTHDVVIGPLDPNTVYYYRCGSSSPELSFKTPPSQFPIKFAIIDLERLCFVVEQSLEQDRLVQLEHVSSKSSIAFSTRLNSFAAL